MGLIDIWLHVELGLNDYILLVFSGVCPVAVQFASVFDSSHMYSIVTGSMKAFKVPGYLTKDPLFSTTTTNIDALRGGGT